MAISWADFERVDMRVGVITDAQPFPEASVTAGVIVTPLEHDPLTPIVRVWAAGSVPIFALKVSLGEEGADNVQGGCGFCTG